MPAAGGPSGHYRVSAAEPRRVTGDSGRGGLAGVGPGLALFDIHIVREAEHALRDDVALDLGRPAADRERSRIQEAVGPLPVVRAEGTRLIQQTCGSAEITCE